MYKKQNLHIHSTFCDGKDTPEEMIAEAQARGFDSLGFSIHSYLSCSNSRLVTMDRIEGYKREMARLKKAYSGIIDLYCGIEYDVMSEHSYSEYDYVIASVHYLDTVGGKRGFDVGLEGTLEYIRTLFGGDSMAFAKAYYDTLSSVPDRGKFDIIGHFDILTKNNELSRFIDVDSDEYLKLAFGAIDALAGRLDVFEVNTGAISRGYRSTPYPSLPILKELCRRGFSAVITSDCHNKDFIDCHFEESRELLRTAGFKSKLVFTRNGFEEVAL